MNLAYLAYRNMISKPLNLILSLLLLVLSVSLVTFILQLSKQLNGQIDKNIDPVDMVVGAKGSPLQLVLSSVLHIDVPTGNIQLGEANTIKNHPFVGSAIPVSYGDNYKGYRILGTELAYFESYGAVLKEGRYFEQTFEAVVGSSVAKKLGLKIGDVFTSSHGLVAANAHAHEDHPYTIVGLLEPTGTVLDQLLVSNLQSVWDAHAHEDEEEEAHDHEGDDHEGHGDEAHDHKGDDHEGHDHEAHDHEGHDHEGHEDDAHDQEGHDHEGHDHEGHEDEAHDQEDHYHEGHDHEGHDHESHDHETHDHEGHDHEGHDHEGHGDEAHNHEGHDHEGHDHEGQDHEGHDHETHDHEGHEDEAHDHEGHNHEGHDHEAHDHEGDDHEGHDHEAHDQELEITSLLIKFKSPLGLVQLPRFINENTNMQAALPGFEIQRLMGLLGTGAKTINGIAIAILLVSGFSIFISLLKTIRERRQELALLRTYGLGTQKLLRLVLFEGLFLALIGFVLGWLLGRLALVVASGYIESGYGYILQIKGPDLIELLFLGVTLVIAIIAVFLASTSIFKLNISKILADV